MTIAREWCKMRARRALSVLRLWMRAAGGLQAHHTHATRRLTERERERPSSKVFYESLTDRVLEYSLLLSTVGAVQSVAGYDSKHARDQRAGRAPTVVLTRPRGRFGCRHEPGVEPGLAPGFRPGFTRFHPGCARQVAAGCSRLQATPTPRLCDDQRRDRWNSSGRLCDTDEHSP